MHTRVSDYVFFHPAFRRSWLSYNLVWDPEVAHSRKEYLKIVLRATGLIILLTWACLPMYVFSSFLAENLCRSLCACASRYFGSLSSSASRVGSLGAWFVNHDQGRMGNNLQATVQDAIDKSQTFGWTIFNQSEEEISNDSIANAVLKEKIWLAVVGESRRRDFHQ